jgi:hypothetical protein
MKTSNKFSALALLSTALLATSVTACMDDGAEQVEPDIESDEAAAALADAKADGILFRNRGVLAGDGDADYITTGSPRYDVFTFTAEEPIKDSHISYGIDVTVPCTDNPSIMVFNSFGILVGRSQTSRCDVGEKQATFYERLGAGKYRVVVTDKDRKQPAMNAKISIGKLTVFEQ